MKRMLLAVLLVFIATPECCADAARFHSGVDTLTAEFDAFFIRENFPSGYEMHQYVKWIPSHRAYIDNLNSRGETPLTHIVLLALDTLATRGSNEAEIFALLIIGGLAGTRKVPRAGIDVPNSRGLTPLMCTILPEEVKGAYPEKVARGGSEIEQCLIELGADPELPDRDGENTVSKALRAPIANRLILQHLLELDLRRPESLRAQGGNTALTLPWLSSALLEKFLTEERWGWTTEEKNEGFLVPAEWGLDMARVRLFLNAGVDINLRDGSGKNLLMKFLSEAEVWKNLTSQMLAELLDLGLDVAARSNDGETLLTIDSPFVPQSPKYLEVLLRAGADVSARNDRGRTCLHLARPASSMKVLLDAGADPNAADRNGQTPLYFATTRDSIALLLAEGVRVDHRDANGDTPLLAWMRSHGYVDGVRIFLEAGADPDAMAFDGTTPRLLASGDAYYAACFEEEKDSEEERRAGR